MNSEVTVMSHRGGQRLNLPGKKKLYTYFVVSKHPQTAKNLPESSILLRVLTSWES